jgi:hypothetical protein
MRKARTLLIAISLAAFVTTLAIKTMLVSPPRAAETVSNTVSVHELHRTMRDLPVQETKDPV